MDGDPHAFELLFSRHRDRLWAVALRTTGDPEEAADALQDALIAAFRRAESFRGDAAVTTWLHRIVVNACLDRLRRRRVRRADPLPADLENAAAGLKPGPGPLERLPDPADLAVDHERRASVLAALATLPQDQRAALVLVDMEGYSVAGDRRDPRLRHRHGEEPLLPGRAPAAAAAGRHRPGRAQAGTLRRPRASDSAGTETRRPVPRQEVSAA